MSFCTFRRFNPAQRKIFDSESFISHSRPLACNPIRVRIDKTPNDDEPLNENKTSRSNDSKSIYDSRSVQEVMKKARI